MFPIIVNRTTSALTLFNRLPRSLDAAIVVACLLSGALIGSGYFRHVFASGGKPWFYQVDFGPAVMWTCGQGFVLPDVSSMPPLAAFLQGQEDRFACGNLPAAPPLRTVDSAQPWVAWSHLLRSAALIWSVTGISWSGLAPLAGAFFAVTVALTYILLRLVSRPVLAVAGVGLVMTSPLFLIELPQFRDFSKVPFLLAIAWLLAQLIAPALSARRLMAVAATYGATLGVGIGFRNDPLITIPPFVALIALARVLGPAGAWRTKAIGLVLAGTLFLVLASPVLRVYTNGGGATMPHAALLGMMSPIDAQLGMSNGRAYEIGYGLEDSYAAALISSHASRKAGRPVPIAGHSREYDEASSDFLREIAFTLPADMLLRAYAAIQKVVVLPSGLVETQPLPYAEASWLRRFYSWRGRLAGAVTWIWPVGLVAALLLVSMRNLPLAATLGGLTLYFTAYPSIQFNDRHILHLSLIPIAAVLFTVESLLRRQWQGSLVDAAGFGLAAVVLIVTPLVGLRWYQQQQVSEMLRSYLAASTDPVDLTQRPLPAGQVALDFAPPGEPMATVRDAVRSDFLVAEFAAGACDAAGVGLTLRYDSSDAFADFTHRISVPVPSQAGSSTTITLALFSYRSASGRQAREIWYHPRGLELPAEQVPCLSRLSRLRAPSQFPLLLNTILSAGWPTLPHHQSLNEWELRPESPDQMVYTDPPGLHVPRPLLAALGPIRAVDLDESAANVSVDDAGRLRVNGTGGLGGFWRFAYLVRFKPRPLVAGQRLMVEGHLERGGISIGLLRDGQWAVQLPITEPGPFVAAIAPPDSGDYALIVANNLKGTSSDNRFELTRLGWLP